jgi:hypothetical protein
MAEPAGRRSRETLAALLRLFVKTLLAAALVFVLARIVAPDLMDIKNDIAFWAGLACWPLAIIVGVGAAISIARDLRGLGGGARLPVIRHPDRD